MSADIDSIQGQAAFISEMQPKPTMRCIEAAITRHCINTCRNCNHFSHLHKPYFMDIDVLKRDIINITNAVTFNRFAVLGGEPLLHPKIDDIIEMIKSLNLFKEVTMTTNGQLLHRASDRFWSLIDTVDVSAYPDKISEQELERLGKNKKVRINITNKFYPQAPTKSDEETLNRYQRCWYRFCLSIDEGYFYRCPSSIYIPQLFLNEKRETDGIPLQGVTYKQIKDFLDSPTPLKSCSKCFNFDCSTSWEESKDPWKDAEVQDCLKENPKFNEEVYLENNPDVAAAVRQGQYFSGLHHYVLWGKNENRIASL